CHLLEVLDLIGVAVGAGSQKLVDAYLDRGEGRADLMRRRSNEVFLSVHKPVDLGAHRVERSGERRDLVASADEDRFDQMSLSETLGPGRHDLQPAGDPAGKGDA